MKESRDSDPQGLLLSERIKGLRRQISFSRTYFLDGVCASSKSQLTPKSSECNFLDGGWRWEWAVRKIVFLIHFHLWFILNELSLLSGTRSNYQDDVSVTNKSNTLPSVRLRSQLIQQKTCMLFTNAYPFALETHCQCCHTARKRAETAVSGLMRNKRKENGLRVGNCEGRLQIKQRTS